MKLLLIVLLNFISISCFSQAGFLDKTFGDNGKVYTSDNAYSFTGAIQADDKILVGAGTIEGYTLLRYFPDGATDTSFGSKGFAAIRALSYPTGVRILEGGEIITGGTASGDIAAAKFKQNGSLDSSFGKKGYVVYDLGGLEYINAMQVQTDDKIILAGRITK